VKSVSEAIYRADFLEVRQCRRGVFGYYTTDQVQGASLAEYGELYDPQVSLLLELIEGDDLVLDVGAGIGAYTIPLARKMLPKGGAIYAFEPSRLNQQMMVMNVALNRLVNVFDHRCMVGAEAGAAMIPIMNPLKKQDFSLLPHTDERGDMVQIIPLDALGVARCKLIKVDTGGTELQVLQGATELMQRLGPVLFVAYPGPERIAELLSFMLGAGYEVWWHFADLYQPNNFAQSKRNLFSRLPPDVNLLAFPKSAGVDLPNMVPVSGPADDWANALMRGQQRR